MFWRKSTLNSKLIMGTIILVVVPLAAISIFISAEASSSLQKLATQQTISKAKDLAALAQLLLSEEIKASKGLAISNTVVNAAEQVEKNGIANSPTAIANLDQMLANIMHRKAGEYEVIFVANDRGIIYSDGTGGGYKDINITDRAYFKSAESGRTNIGEVVLSKKTGDAVLVISSPVLSKAGKFLGIVATALKTKVFNSNIANTRIGKAGYAFIVDQSGEVIAHPDKALILKMNITKMPGMKEITKSMFNGKAGIQSYVDKRGSWIAGYAPVPLTRWSIAVIQPASQFLAPIHRIHMGILIIAGIFLLICLVVSFLFAKSISKPISEAVNGLYGSADQVAAASSQISSTSQSLAEGTSQQAASLEETSSSLEEMASMTRQNAGNAQQSNALMAENIDALEAANTSMKQLTTSMRAIFQSSEETQKIVKTIDEIAFQTNLLALNAAVEAARAGEAGAGFAVVADEVRNLAMRAAEAAKSTEGLIEGSVKQTQDGSQLVERTAADLSRVTEGASKMKELVSEIAAASDEQTQGIELINKAVSEMDQVVQQNAANAEESASASEEMRAQAQHMKKFVAGLAALVGGNGKSQASSPLGKDSLEGTAATPPSRQLLTSRRNSRKGNGTAPTVSKGRFKEVTSQQVIPLADQDYSDF